MSIVDAEYNPESKSLQLVIKFFVDDLELVLEKENEQVISIGTAKENSNTNDFLIDYLSKHFILEQSKGSLSFRFIGKEVDMDYVWVYIEYTAFDPDDSTSLTNSLLTDYFASQTNKINIAIQGKNKSFTLHKNNIRTEF